MAFYATSSMVGVDLNNPGSTQLFALGTKCQGTEGSEWVYIEARTAITAFKCVGIPINGTAGMVSAADTISGDHILAFAQTSFSSGQFGWVPIRGLNMYVMMTGSSTLTQGVIPVCVAGSGVSTGMCSMVATATGTLVGIGVSSFGSGGQTATATAYQCILSYPKFAAPSLP